MLSNVQFIFIFKNWTYSYTHPEFSLSNSHSIWQGQRCIKWANFTSLKTVILGDSSHSSGTVNRDPPGLVWQNVRRVCWRPDPTALLFVRDPTPGPNTPLPPLHSFHAKALKSINQSIQGLPLHQPSSSRFSSSSSSSSSSRASTVQLPQVIPQCHHVVQHLPPQPAPAPTGPLPARRRQLGDPPRSRKALTERSKLSHLRFGEGEVGPSVAPKAPSQLRRSPDDDGLTWGLSGCSPSL